MKRETKKVTRKATKRPTRKRFVTIKDVAAAAFAEGLELHITTIPDLDSVKLNLSETWKEQLRQAAKLCGEPEEQILQRIAKSFMRWKPTYLHIAEFSAKGRLREEMEAAKEAGKISMEAAAKSLSDHQTATEQEIQARADAVLSEVKRRVAEMPKGNPIHEERITPTFEGMGIFSQKLSNPFIGFCKS